jgi:deoxyribodipyrimidine photo-lyase
MVARRNAALQARIRRDPLGARQARAAAVQAWCEGRTGYPLVDAAMAQINQTGYMHNRLRMVAASFLVKDLGIDWRWGEPTLRKTSTTSTWRPTTAAGNGPASSGCDAQPYFRIFNPVSQSEKFDPQGKFIRRYLPQLARLPARPCMRPGSAAHLELAGAGVTLGKDYPAPIVMHDEARANRRCSATASCARPDHDSRPDRALA